MKPVELFYKDGDGLWSVGRIYVTVDVDMHGHRVHRVVEVEMYPSIAFKDLKKIVKRLKAFDGTRVQDPGLVSIVVHKEVKE